MAVSVGHSIVSILLENTIEELTAALLVNLGEHLGQHFILRELGPSQQADTCQGQRADGWEHCREQMPSRSVNGDFN